MSVSELGKRLVDRRQVITAMEAEWFEWLVEFDNHCDWTLDGHANCVSWLVDHCGMAHPTWGDDTGHGSTVTATQIAGGSLLPGSCA